MKIILALPTTSIGFFFTATAQVKNEQSKTHFGLKAGYNHSSFTNISSIGGRGNGGFHAGVFFSGKEDFVNASVDLLYLKQGYSYQTGNVSMTYFTSTQTADFFPGEQDVFKLSVGFHTGYLFAAHADSSGVPLHYPGKNTTTYFNRFSFGIAGGAEVLTKNGLLFGIRYVVGINNLLKKQNTGEFIPAFINAAPGVVLKNNILQLYAGFRF